LGADKKPWGTKVSSFYWRIWSSHCPINCTNQETNYTGYH